jgi:hypothetical protein
MQLDLLAITGVPMSARAIVESLQAEPLLPIPTLRAQIERHLRELREGAVHNEFLDLDLAEQLAVSCRALLDGLGDSPPPRHHRLTQIAVRYFILDEDGESDLTSLLGLEDDAEVLNAVCLALGRPDLEVTP